MVFYLTPPTGSASLSCLERLCTVRFEYLKHLTDVTNLDEYLASTSIEFFVQNSDCLMEHNPRDKLSYFTLRLLSLQCGRLRALVEAGERRLLRYRLQLMTPAELRDTLRRTAARAGRLRVQLPAGPPRRLLDTLVSVTAAADRHLAEHKPDGDGRASLDACRQPVVRVPFALVAPLVAARAVSLSAGYALLLCHHTPEALSCLQEAVLGLHSTPPAADERLVPLLTRLRARLTPPPAAGEAAPLSLATLDGAAPLLPPCMLALHAELCRRHRLPHRDRITLSAFVKDAGLPLQENIRFWEREYSQPAGDGSACSHTWSRCQKRYLYSLRHMYGLEGRRVAYVSHSCQTLQERCEESLSSCGGCPFVGFDAESLSTLLTSEAGLSAAEAAPLLADDGAAPAVRCRRYRDLLLRRQGWRGRADSGDGGGGRPTNGNGCGVRGVGVGVAEGSAGERGTPAESARGREIGRDEYEERCLGHCDGERELRGDGCDRRDVCDGGCTGSGHKDVCVNSDCTSEDPLSASGQLGALAEPENELKPFTKPSEFFRDVLEVLQTQRNSCG